MASEQRAALDLRGEDAIDLGNATDFYILLQAIDEVMPADSVLVLEGDATAPAIADFLRAHEPVDKPELVANSSGRYRAFHLPLAGDNLHQLRVLADACAAPEVAFHLMVYRGAVEISVEPTPGHAAVSHIARGMPEGWDSFAMPADCLRSYQNKGDTEAVMLLMTPGDGRKTIHWAPEVVTAAGQMDRAVDANGFVGLKRFVDRSQR